MEETELVELIVKYHGDLSLPAKELGAEVELLLGSYAILTLPRVQIPALLALPLIEHAELPRELSFEGSAALVATCTEAIHEQNPWNLRGRGVLLALLDSGLDYSHPDFRDADGGSRILYLWDQTATTGSPPEGFAAGAEYSKEEIDKALAGETILPFGDDLGHGTAVAGIAAGGRYGVAPEASLLVVKLGRRGQTFFTRTSELMRAVKYAVLRARELQMPLALNMSIGMSEGSHRGDSLFETYLDTASRYWKCVFVVPTGNEGAAGHHARAQLRSFEEKELRFFTAGGLERFFVSIWKDFVDSFAVELIMPGGFRSGPLRVSDATRLLRAEGWELRMSYGQPSHDMLSSQIYLELHAEESPRPSGLWRLRFYPEEIVNGRLDLWLPTLEAVGPETFFAEPETRNSLTIPATAQRLISVAAYRSRSDSLLDFSGRGPETDPFFKPDLAAPGADILASSRGGGYDSVTGSSFAAPFVTGAAALMMEWGIVRGADPFLYGQRVKAFLRLGAQRGSQQPYPNPSWGYGRLCLARSMDYLKQYGRAGGVDNWTLR